MTEKDPRRAGRVLFVNRFFWPDHSATAQILSDLSFDLAARGWHVEIITSRLSYDNPGQLFPRREIERGVVIHRVATTSLGRDHLLGRMIDYLSFFLTSWFAALTTLRRGDLFVVKTDPPMLLVPMRLVAILRGAKQINWLQDIFPEIAGALGVTAANGLVARALTVVRNWALRYSACNVVIGDRMAERLESAGVPPCRIVTIHNWTDDTVIRPPSSVEHPLRVEWSLASQTRIVMYSGNLGRAHDLETILAAAKILCDAGRKEIKFLFVGGGHLRRTLDEALKKRALTNIATCPYQPREKLPLSLTVADIHWLSLNPALEGLIVPSKFYGAAASGRPVLFIGDANGEIARLILKSECGWVFAPGDSDGVATLLSTVDAQELIRRGANARRLIETGLRCSDGLLAWRSLLSAINGASQPDE